MGGKYLLMKEATDADIRLAEQGYFLYQTDTIDMEKGIIGHIYHYICSELVTPIVQGKSIYLDIFTSWEEMKRDPNHIVMEILFDTSQNAVGIQDPSWPISWMDLGELEAVCRKAAECGITGCVRGKRYYLFYP